ncbi:Predicted acetyltransferase [Streptomyces sp. TLI_053]|uniref:GNAT family N-acetyltransferase n=1 Tax=Streptomyces sp. TLI_053 TaxID=1855352 RepID=UPI00087B24B4|nr:GNAT family N-acetyltransferase [Streptomyces sp. TLI_053]SDT83422.1 Predicted acetyltransferase [Streptomyces sp. TLI_053]
MTENLTVTAPDDAQWVQYTALATRAYGHPVADLDLLRPHADARVGLRAGRIVAGGLGLLVTQHFGGLPVPAACLAAGSIAPEERGAHLSVRMLAERLRPLQDQGAVLATVWSTSTGYARRLGWAAPTPVFSWTVPTDDLKRAFDHPDAAAFAITHHPDRPAGDLQRTLATRWNGPWQRPAWWSTWQQQTYPRLATYTFAEPGRPPAGQLSLTLDEHPADGRSIAVRDFWAADHRAAAAMLAFVARHNSRIPTVCFQRTGMPPTLLLQHRLHRAGAATARHWHPWMLRVLDPAQAVRLRGWPEDLDFALPIDLLSEDGEEVEHLALQITDGKADLTCDNAPRTRRLTLTRPQFATWYAGGYRCAEAAHLDGVQGDPRDVRALVAATGDRQPFLPEYF